MIFHIDNSERPLKLSEMARHLGVSVRWLRGEAERGALPHVKADTGLLFDRATVERLLAERARREGVADDK
jgi:DNA-binding transcriptional MerR regulator